MEAAYSDLRSAGSFGGLNNLRRYAGATTRSAREFLAKRDSYTLHKPRRLRFPRRKTYSKNIADLYQMDLVDVFGLSSHNDRSRYLLTCIDVIRKRAWAFPVRRKTGRNVAEAFEKILTDGNCNMFRVSEFDVSVHAASSRHKVLHQRKRGSEGRSRRERPGSVSYSRE